MGSEDWLLCAKCGGVVWQRNAAKKIISWQLP